MSIAAPNQAAPAAPPATPVPAAPAAPTPPVTPPAPPPAAPDADPKATGRGKRVFDLLIKESESEPGKKTEPATPPAAPAAAAAPATPPAAVPDPDKPIKATRKPAISKRPEPPAPVAPAVPTPTATPATPKNDEEWEAGLVDQEKQLLSDAAEAEAYLPARKGLKEQAKKFIKAHVKYLETHDDTDDGGDGEAAYQKFLKQNQPALSEAEQRDVSERRIAARVAQPLQKDADDLRHQLFVRDEEPKIEQQANRVVSDLNTNAMPAEILQFAKEHGVEEAKKQFADELTIHNTIVSSASSDYRELVRLGTLNPANGRPLAVPMIDPVTRKPVSEQHQRLEVIVKKANEDFRNGSKEADLVRDGKWFVTRDEWNSGYKDFPDRYWTFTNKEIADRSLAWVKPAIETTIQQNRAAMTKRGYVRPPYTPAVPPAPAPEPTRSAPGPSASPVPSPSAGGATPQTPGARLASVLTQG